MMYVVEIGGIEVFVYLLAKGDYDQGIEAQTGRGRRMS